MYIRVAIYCYPHSLVVLDLVVPLDVLDPIVPLDVLDSLVPLDVLDPVVSLDVLDLTVLLVGEAVIEEHTIPEPTQDKRKHFRVILVLYALSHQGGSLGWEQAMQLGKTIR